MRATSPSPRPADEAGFTLIELLIVLLIIGILAAVAIPTLLQNKAMAGDAAAKSLMHSAQETAMTYSLNGVGTFSGMTPAVLNGLEKTINITANGKAVLVNATPQASGYLLTVVSSTANTFNLTSTNGVLSRTCTVVASSGDTRTNTGGGCHGGTW